MTQTILRIETPYGHTFMAREGTEPILLLPDGTRLSNVALRAHSDFLPVEGELQGTPELRRELCWRRMNGPLVLADGSVTWGASLALVTATWRFGDEHFARLFVPSLCQEGYGRIADREVPPPSGYPWAGQHGASIPLAWWAVQGDGAPMAAFAQISRVLEIADRARVTLVALPPEAVDIDPSDEARLEVWRMVTWLARESNGLLVVQDRAPAKVNPVVEAVAPPTPPEPAPAAPAPAKAPAAPNRNGGPSIPRARV